MKVKNRLNEIIQFAKNSKKICDIGCDHGIVGIELLVNHSAEFVVFSDLLESPLSSAICNAKECNVDQNKVSFRVGDGLSTVEFGEVDTVIVAGMGGKTIVDILSSDVSKTRSFKTFIFQPTNGEDVLRKWLCENGFVIDNETLICDNQVFYETFLVSQGDEVLSEKEIQFGKCIDYSDHLFVLKYSTKLKNLENIKNQIPESNHARIAEFNQRINLIKEVLEVHI